ncbi:DoxX family protein [Tsukamurella sp. 8F]|uniref:DoxX family protein n=1 Tax=unclassified Tsukamurella TaxID=2633480 RepID=UPI0023B99307|nr:MULTISPECIES: DoxX family protein [unclassified Tsukamurella]MDF0529741.1 DoxX family protein [Tsukamurella sp. 8J]MDF0586026.1 DoxX family protein [Tsukamurella sp. 8F]
MSIETIRDPRAYQVFAAFQAIDAAICVKPIPYVQDCLTDVEFPRRYWRLFPVVKSASAVGLAAAPRYPGLARLTALALTVYFCCAVGAHIRTRDLRLNFAAASSLLAAYATLAATGPRPAQSRT